MGSELVSFMCNLFLCYYKGKWIRKIKIRDILAAPKFSNIFHSINDLTVINNSSEFEKALHKIYHPELELKKENTSPFEASSSDLDIKISNKNFPLFEYHICQVIHLLKYFMPYFELKFLE